MTDSSPRPARPSHGRSLRVACWAVMLALVAAPAPLPAADDVVVDELPSSSAADAAGAVGRPQVFLVRGNNRLVLRGVVGLQEVPVAASPTVELGGLFDRIAFGPEAGGNRSGADPEAAIRDLGEKRIDLLDEVCGLSARQRRGLELALASDLADFAAERAARRTKYAGVEMSVRPGALDRELVVELRADATACRSRWQNFFGPASLLASTTPRVLEPEQREAVVTWVDSRRAERWRAMLTAVLLEDGHRRLWRSPEAATEVVRLLGEEVPPLAVFAAACDPPLEARMTKLQRSLVFARLGRVPEQTLQPLVQPGSWVGLRQEIDRIEQPGQGHVERQLTLRQVLEEEQP